MAWKAEVPVCAPEPRSGVSTERFFDEVYQPHVNYIWRTLRAMGLSGAMLEDAAQDVFLVVHRKLAEFDERCAIKT